MPNSTDRIDLTREIAPNGVLHPTDFSSRGALVGLGLIHSGGSRDQGLQFSPVIVGPGGIPREGSDEADRVPGERGPYTGPVPIPVPTPTPTPFPSPQKPPPDSEEDELLEELRKRLEQIRETLTNADLRFIVEYHWWGISVHIGKDLLKILKEVIDFGAPAAGALGLLIAILIPDPLVSKAIGAYLGMISFALWALGAVWDPLVASQDKCNGVKVCIPWPVGPLAYAPPIVLPA